MVKKFIYGLMFLGCISFCSSGLLASKELYEKAVTVFAQTYAPPQELSKLIAGHSGKFEFGDVVKGKNQAYICKGCGFTALCRRLVNARRLSNVITKYNLSIGVVEKYACVLNNEIYIFAEFVVSDEDSEEVSLDEVKDIDLLAQKTNFMDFSLKKPSFNNLIRRFSDGKLMIIDTEDGAFAPTEVFLKHYSLFRLLGFNDLKLQWIQKYGVPSITRISKPITENSKYDDEGVDFEKLKQKLKQQVSFVQSKL